MPQGRTYPTIHASTAVAQLVADILQIKGLPALGFRFDAGIVHFGSLSKLLRVEARNNAEVQAGQPDRSSVI